MFTVGALLLQLVLAAHCTVYFEERFLDSDLSKWEVSSMSPGTDQVLGKFELKTPKKVNDEKEDFGMKTTEDAKFYRASSEFDKVLSTKDKTLCVQLSVKHEQDMDCGGGYIKLMSEDFSPANLTGDSDYQIMFGPDICGYSKKIVHVILSHNGKNHLIKREIPCPSDTKSHLYTLIVKPDNTYEVLVDQESKQSGSLVDDWDMLPPKEIKDPNEKKPSDWVDEAEIDDPDVKKPEDWDKPANIPDPKATKPEDWDDEIDGEWVPANIPNPEFKGEWHPKKIANPAYKGEWVHPMIPNPDFKQDAELYVRHIKAVALDLWQVKSGTIFDNMIVTDSVDECKDHAKYWKARSDFEVTAEKEEEPSKSDGTTRDGTEDDEVEEPEDDTEEENKEDKEKEEPHEEL